MATIGSIVTDFSELPGFLTNTGCSVTNGQGVLPCTSSYFSFAAFAGYDLTNSAVSLNVVSSPGAVGTREFILRLQLDGSNQISMYHSTNTFRGRVTTAGVDSIIDLGTYNSTTHAWWRIRNNGDTSILFDTSSDGFLWFNRAAIPCTWAITSVVLFIYCGYYGTETGPPDAVIDDLNMTPFPIANTPLLVG